VGEMGALIANHIATEKETLGSNGRYKVDSWLPAVTCALSCHLVWSPSTHGLLDSRTVRTWLLSRVACVRLNAS